MKPIVKQAVDITREIVRIEQQENEQKDNLNYAWVDPHLIKVTLKKLIKQRQELEKQLEEL